MATDLYSQEEGVIDAEPIIGWLKASEAISAFNIVKLSGDGPPPTVAKATVNTGIGVALQAAAASGDLIPVMLRGVVKIVAGGAITRGQAITSDANAKAAALADVAQAVNEGGTATYTINVRYSARVGKALQTTTTDGDEFLAAIGI